MVVVAFVLTSDPNAAVTPFNVVKNAFVPVALVVTRSVIEAFPIVASVNVVVASVDVPVTLNVPAIKLFPDV